DLVRRDLEDRFVPLDRISHLLQPLGDRPLGNRLTHLRHDDFCGHGSPLLYRITKRVPRRLSLRDDPPAQPTPHAQIGRRLAMKWGSLPNRGRVFPAFGVALSAAAAPAQFPANNVNMVSGPSLPGGDPFLQRQNEPSIALSSRNAQRLLAGANDYRTVDLPGLPDGEETGDAWLGVFKSDNRRL